MLPVKETPKPPPADNEDSDESVKEEIPVIVDEPAPVVVEEPEEVEDDSKDWFNADDLG